MTHTRPQVVLLEVDRRLFEQLALVPSCAGDHLPDVYHSCLLALAAQAAAAAAAARAGQQSLRSQHGGSALQLPPQPQQPQQPLLPEVQLASTVADASRRGGPVTPSG